ncbi:MAG: hypothetical protein PHF05_00455, partial [Candidatus Izemoplasmatales bacterium]|nr:hypothetical protein [Candidatus Izemoplasmatales bacterium]
MDNSYLSVMSRKNQIMQKSVGINYDQYESDYLNFDYEAMLSEGNFTIEEIRKIQNDFGVGNTPLKECKNIAALARKVS